MSCLRGAPPSFSNIALDTLTHTSVRVSWTLSVPSHVQIRFGTSSGAYPYATYSLQTWETSSAIALNALKPATTYYLRVTARPNPGDDVDICQTGACGSVEQTFTTLPEPAQHPQPPAPPAAFSASPPDTTGYVTVTVSQLSNGSCNLQDLINAAAYGTIVEIPQGMTCKVFPAPANDNRGIKLPIKPLDPAAGGNIHSPDHRWIVIRTAAGPADLPLPGVRVTPRMAAVFGKLVAQTPVSSGDVMFAEENRSGCTEPDCGAQHHYRIETLELTHANGTGLFPADAADPRPFGFLVQLQSQPPNNVPTHIVFDRIYLHGQGAPTRVRAAMLLEGRYVGLTNSYIDKIDYWRPVQAPDEAVLLSPDLKTLSAPSKAYQRRKTDAVWTMPGPATAQLTADAAYSGAFVGYLGPAGLTIEYTAPGAPGSAAISCANCVAVAKTSPAAPPDRFLWFEGTILDGRFNLTRALTSASQYVSEGSVGIYGNDGRGPYLIENNYLEAYGINYLIDNPGGSEPIQDITFRRNTLFWNQDHRITSPTSDGYLYLVRNMWEVKRGSRILLEGNVLEGTWASVNQGASIFLSSRPAAKTSYGQGTRDITIRGNIIRNSSAGVYCQGTSQSGSDPPSTGNVLIANNLFHGINQWEQDASSPNGLGDNLRILSGCHDVAVRNNTFASNLGRAPYQLISGYIWNEGLAFNDNILYLNLGAYNQGGIGLDSSNDAGHPYVPAMPGGTYKNNLDKAFVRLGPSIETSYEMRNNVIVGGVRKASKDSAATDLTASDFAAYKAQYPSGNLFPEGGTRAEREAVVKFTDVAANNFRLSPDSPYRAGGPNPATNGKAIGIDNDELEASLGLVKNVVPPVPGNGAASFSYLAPDARACVVETSRDQFTTSRRSSDAGGARTRNLTVQGLLTGATYSYRILCYYEQINDAAHPTAYPADQIASGTFQTLVPTAALMTSPAAGAAFASTAVTFQWSAGVAATEYILEIGTAPGSADLYGASQGTNLSRTIVALPANGSSVYVRLSTKTGAGTQIQDYVYTAYTALITADSVGPASGSGQTVTFTAVYGDTAGYGDLHSAYLMVNTTLEGSSSCYIQHQRATNTFHLLGDNNVWQGPVGAGPVVQNSQCTLNAVGTSAAGAGNTLTLTVSLTFKSAFSGFKTVYLYALANGGLNSGWQSRGGWTVVTPGPTADSVTPGSGSGSSTTLSAVYSDASGYANLHSAYLLVNTAVAGANSCYVQYQRATNTFFLLDDSNAWQGPLTPGSAGALQNNQCTLSGAGTSAAGAGNTLTLNLALDFKSPFAGAKSVYLYALALNGVNSGWQNRGSWTAVAPAVAPTADSVSPASGSGSGATLTAVYGDLNGYTDLRSAYLLVNSTVDSVNSCSIEYERTSGGYYLLNDSGTVRLGPLAPGSSGSLQNSQCVLHGVGTSAAGSGNSLSMTVALSFKPGYAGPKSVYAYALTLGGLNSGWQSRGAWTVTAPAVAPAAESVSPAAGGGSSASFSAVYSDANGYTDLHSAYLLVNTAVDSVNSCFIQYQQAGAAFYLLNDSGTAWLGPLTGGSSAALQNSQCTLSGAGSSASGAASRLTLTLALSFKPAFAGAKSVYAYAVAVGGLTSGWQSRGAWTVLAPNLAPTADSVSPSSGSGSSATLAVAYGDPAGYTDLHSVYVSISSAVDSVNSCFIQHQRGDNSLYLLSDNGSAWLGPLASGASGSLQNAQCTLNGTGSSVSGSGNILTLTAAVSFKAAFAGVKSVYGYALTLSGLNSGWQSRGTWTVVAPPAGPGPASDSLTPASGSGASAVFRAGYFDPNGYGNLHSTYLLVNTTPDGPNSCFVQYQRDGNAFYLLGDTGVWLGPLPVASSGNVQNNQCVLSGTGSLVSGAGNNLAMTVSLSFKGAFAGARSVFLYALSSSGLNSGWQNRGSWTVPAPGQAAPASDNHFAPLGFTLLDPRPLF